MENEARKCCGVEHQVVTSYNRVMGDNSPDTETELYRVLVMACINPNCPECGKQYEVAHKQQIGGENV